MGAIRIEEEYLIKLKKLCVKEGGIDQKRYLELMIDYFEKNEISPKSYTTNDSLRNTFVSFIVTQEKKFLTPIKNDVSMMNDNYDEIKDTLSFILEKLNK